MADQVQLISSCDLPTLWGDFKCSVYHLGEEEMIVISQGELEGSEKCFLRLHSACFTGEILGSLKCDCREQLELALKKINEVGHGAIFYLQQEGRGIGLANKIKAYDLQNKLGLDTEEANLHLGFQNDLRDYTFAASVLKELKIKSVSLNTNNPNKRAFLEKAGFEVAEQISSVTETNQHNRAYLKTKVLKHGHTGLDHLL